MYKTCRFTLYRHKNKLSKKEKSLITLNIWKSIKWTADKEVNAKAIFAVMNTTWAVMEIRPEKNSGLYGIWTHDLCDTGEVLYQLSQQANNKPMKW